MKKIIAFGGSNSKSSINKALATYVSGLMKDVDANVLDLNDYKLPVYSIDIENESGIPSNARQFLDELHSSDGIILSLAEHNGAYSAAFKNIFDWMSRIDGKLWHDIPMLLMATSPGKRGGRSVLDIAGSRFPYMGGNIVAEFSLPSFYENFENGEITDITLKKELEAAIETFHKKLNQ